MEHGTLFQIKYILAYVKTGLETKILFQILCKKNYKLSTYTYN